MPDEPNTDYPTSPKPEYPLEETAANPSVLISVHVDGSEQRRLKGAGDGVIFTLTYGATCPVTATDRSAILDHFAARNGTLTAFDFAHPERAGETTLVRYLEAPTFKLVGYNAYSGQVKLKVVPA